MIKELPGIFLWAFEGLRRLHANAYRFTESPRAAANREELRQDANNVIQFLEAEDYVSYPPSAQETSKDLYAAYCLWCEDNSMIPLKSRSFSDFLTTNAHKYGITHVNTVFNRLGRRVWGFKGIRILTDDRSCGKLSPYQDEELPFTDLY